MQPIKHLPDCFRYLSLHGYTLYVWICNPEFYCSSYIYHENSCLFSVVIKLHSSAIYMLNIFIIGVCKSQILWNHLISWARIFVVWIWWACSWTFKSVDLKLIIIFLFKWRNNLLEFWIRELTYQQKTRNYMSHE